MKKISAYLKKNGRLADTICEPNPNASYLSVFITHFFNNPKENIGILRKLYLDFDLSMSKISELTEGKWPKTSIIEALQAHGIKKSDTPIPSKPKYGYKVENGELVLCEKEQKIIKLILELHSQDNSLRKIARILNDKKIKGKYGGLWDKSVISTIIKRETKQQEE